MFCILSVVGFYLSGVRLKVQGDLFEIDTKWISRHPRYTQIGTFVFESNMYMSTFSNMYMYMSNMYMYTYTFSYGAFLSRVLA